MQLSDLATANQQSTILSDDGTVIWRSTQHKRLTAKSSDIPPVLTQALTSIEDRNFYQESGVNYARTAMAILRDVVHGNNNQGGSTLTQQLVKQSIFSTKESDRTIDRKVKEMMLSEELNGQLSKRQILTLYINKVFMGSGVYGMQTASQFYFGKPLKQINVSQAALLAGMVQSPSYYEPYHHLSAATNRRNTVLDTMVENGVLTKQQARKWKAHPVSDDLVPLKEQAQNVTAYDQHQLTADSYLQATMAQLSNRGVDPQTDSVTVKTSLNLGLQQQLLDIINNNAQVPYRDDQLQVAATIINNETGQVVAQVGGRHQDTIGSYNRANNAERSSGSTIKPIVDYGPALDLLKWNTDHELDDSAYKYPGTNIDVHDWDDRYEGKMTLRKALVESRNIPAIKTLAAVGLTPAQKVLKLAGIDDRVYYSSAIGVNTSTAQMASAFTSLANQGVRHNAQYFKDADTTGTNSQTLASSDSTATSIFSPQTAFMLTDMLKGVPQTGESGSAAKIDGLAQAGKTGTIGYSADAHMPEGALSDAWYVGYTKSYTIAVWTGYDDPNQKTHYLTQSDAAISQTIYKLAMQAVNQTMTPNVSDWSAPDHLKVVKTSGVSEYQWADDSVVAPSLKASVDSDKASSATSSTVAAKKTEKRSSSELVVPAGGH